MWLYLTFFLFLSVLGFIEINRKSRKVSYAFFFFFIVLFYILSFVRWETGTDWDNYYAMFSWIKQPFYSYDSNIEWGYWFVSNLAYSLSESYSVALFLYATIILYFSIRAFLANTNFLLFSFLIWYCIALANLFFVRQSIAYAILLFSIKIISDKKKTVFLLCVFTAFLFHRSALLFLIAYPIYNLRLKLSTCFSYMFVFGIAGVLFGKLLLITLGDLGGIAFSTRIENYLELGVDDNSMAYSHNLIVLKGFLNRFFLIIIFSYFFKYRRKTDEKVNGLFNLYLFGCVIYFLTLPISVSLARLAVYFDLVQIFLTPMLFEPLNNKRFKFSMYLLLTLYFGMRLMSNVGTYYDSYVPFKTIY